MKMNIQNRKVLCMVGSGNLCFDWRDTDQCCCSIRSLPHSKTVNHIILKLYECLSIQIMEK
jgi:hypothetical protein